MSERDEFRIDELRDEADDRELERQDRAELLGLTPDHKRAADPWGPSPADLEPWEPVFIRHGRKGQ